jgi:prefoldin subunit 5
MRTRRLSDAIAVLGGDVSAERQIDETITKIKKLSRLVEQARLDLLAFAEARSEESRNE